MYYDNMGITIITSSIVKARLAPAAERTDGKGGHAAGQ